MMNKSKNYEMVRNLADGRIQSWTKVRMDNIVLPDMRQCRLLNAILAQVVKTKEQPTGCSYDSASFRVVLRLLDGKVLLEEGGMPDSYCWKHSKVEGAKTVKAIGYKTEETASTSEEFLSKLNSSNDQEMVRELLQFVNADFLLVTTDEESRKVLEVTQELYDAGLTAIVDEWMDVDADGNAQETELNVGDFLVVTNDGYYCIRRAEFLITHKQ